VVNSAIDSRLPLGAEMLGFVDAAVLQDADELEIARLELLDAAGPEVVNAVAGVIATFEMMNRLLDATGAPVHDFLDDITTELGLEIPAHLRGDRK
jgi:hypothetical protein